jgi:hypothetical protein
MDISSNIDDKSDGPYGGNFNILKNMKKVENRNNKKQRKLLKGDSGKKERSKTP